MGESLPLLFLWAFWQPVGQKPWLIEFGILRHNSHHVRFQPQTRRSSPEQLTLRAHSLAPRASRHSLSPLIHLIPIKEELEVPYEIKYYRRGSDHLAPKELLNVHPLGKAPVITDGDVTLAESGAIIRAYLCSPLSTWLIHQPRVHYQQVREWARCST